jgi:hypothetical protein
LVLVASSRLDRAGWSVRAARYFSAELTSAPVTVLSKEVRAALGAVARKSARAASERSRACWAAALSSPRCRVSSSEDVEVWVGSPVTGSMTVPVHAERGEQQPAGGRGLLHGGVEFGQGVSAGAGARRRALGQVLGEPVEFGDGGGVRLVRLQRAALAGERGPSHGRYAVEPGPQGRRRVRVGTQLLDLPVHAGAALLGGGLGLGAAGRDVGGDVVALVGQRVGEDEGVPRLLGERHQLLGVVELPGGGQDGRRAGTGDGRGDHGHGDDQPVAYMGGAALAGGGRRLSALLGGRLLACATRPRLLHRCSHS